MKRIAILLFVISISLCSCSSKAKTRDRAGEPVISTSRVIVGRYLDEQDRKLLDKSSPRTIERIDYEEQLTINDIVKLSQAGISDDIVIKYLQQRKTIYNLTPEQLKKLRYGGTSQRIMAYMVNTGR